MPTYPLAFPSAPNILDFSIRPVRAVGMSQSPFTLSQQVFDHRGARWEGEVSLPPMKYETAGEWEVFILQLRGISGSFLMGPPMARPTGTGTAGNLKVAAAVYDESISVQGAGSGSTFKKGNWLQIGTSGGSRLHKITADATADGAGDVTLNIEPAIKQAYVIATGVTVSSPVGVWRLGASNIGWSVGSAATFGFSFSIMEAL